ncbi:MAG: M23 family metallopeptidase [Clostridia bacterium]|nr:M23 family metallopeptidase [Clostridia bacterium]
MPNNNFRNSKFAQNFRENRAVWVTAITLLVALAVIAAVATVANRSKQIDDTTTPPTDSTTATPPETNPPEPPISDVSGVLPTFAMPVSGTLTKPHDAEKQVFSNTMNDYRVHLGVDIETAASAPVYAAADGTVAEVWEDPLMGQCIAVSHGGDAVSIYKNLATEVAEGIEAGSEVKCGQLLAYVGETAMTELADEPHLHFELTVAGLQVDPLEYFDEEAVATLSSSAYEDTNLTEE